MSQPAVRMPDFNLTRTLLLDTGGLHEAVADGVAR